MYGYSFLETIILGFLLFSGAWGSVFLAARLKTVLRKADLGTGGPPIDAFQDDGHQLEARLGRVEEELRFFRQLHDTTA